MEGFTQLPHGRSSIYRMAMECGSRVMHIRLGDADMDRLQAGVSTPCWGINLLLACVEKLWYHRVYRAGGEGLGNCDCAYGRKRSLANEFSDATD